MRLIDVLRQETAKLLANGFRPSQWRMDGKALAQLQREATSDGDASLLGSAPATFLGVPILEVDMSDQANADYVSAIRRYAPYQTRGKPRDHEWGVFDLDKCEPCPETFGSEQQAEAASLGKQFGRDHA